MSDTITVEINENRKKPEDETKRAKPEYEERDVEVSTDMTEAEAYEFLDKHKELSKKEENDEIGPLEAWDEVKQFRRNWVLKFTDLENMEDVKNMKSEDFKKVYKRIEKQASMGGEAEDFRET